MTEEGGSDVRMGAWRSAHCLHCTVCKTNHDSVDMWLSHLGEAYHQEPARRECFQRWGEDKEMLECVVVLFCSFELGNPGAVRSVMTRFSGGVGGDLVTDFVWWPTRPRLAFIQFESRKKVKGIFKELQGPNGYVQDRLVQLKKAVDILSLQWKELVPEDVAPPQRPLPTSSRLTFGDEASPSSATFPVASCRIPEPGSRLQLQFNSICQSTEIPPSELTRAMEILQVTKEIFKRDHPSGEVLMLRNYYLRLRNGTQPNILFLYAYIPESPSFPDTFESIGKAEHEPMFAQFESQLPRLKQFPLGKWTVGGGRTFLDPSSGFRFNLITDPLFMVEAQLCRLVQYLCTFDPRVRSLLTLVHFWANSHCVRIGERSIPKILWHSSCPEPAALDWLVLIFLTREGVIPSVRDILQRPHKLLLTSKQGHDIGFSPDPDYAREWSSRAAPSVPSLNSDDFLMSVVSLAHRFFSFYATSLETGCWLLNPKDGEIIRREGNNSSHKLTPEEAVALKRTNKRDFRLSAFRIYMLHPLQVRWKLSFCVETWTKSTCAKMKSTGAALEAYLTMVGSGQASLLNLECVLSPKYCEVEPTLTPTQCPNSSRLVPRSICFLEPRSPLQVQWNGICKWVEIPEDEFQKALEIAEVLQCIFRKTHPSGLVVMFRNYHLGLRNTGNDLLLLYAYIAECPLYPDSFRSVGQKEHEVIFSEFDRRLPGFRVTPFSEPTVAGGCPYQHQSSGFRFNFITDPLTMAEVQLCRLLQYMCTFDPRVRPLLALVYFWGRSHGVRIAEEFIMKIIRNSNCPEPAALEWLVILFLSHEGVLPSVRDILDRPHKPFQITKERNDVGFDCDKEFAEQWCRDKSLPRVNSDEFLISVVRLAQGFFHFYASNLESGCWLLNPKDGEIIRREGTRCHKSRLTREETSALNCVQELQQRRNSLKQHLVISDYRIYVLHPLVIGWTLSFCVDTWDRSTCAKMKGTARELEKYLEALEMKNEKGVTFGGPSLEAALGGTGYQTASSDPATGMVGDGGERKRKRSDGDSDGET